MTVYKLEPQPLKQEAFSPFGQVIETTGHTPKIINNGNTARYDQLGLIQCANVGDQAVINIFRAQPRNLPLKIAMLERHPLGSQSFHPLSGEPYLVLVANAVPCPTVQDLFLFIAQPHQGVNYALNTWHHPLLGLNKVCDFLVVDRKGKGNNCEEYFFDSKTEIIIDSL